MTTTTTLVPDCNLTTLMTGIDQLNKRCKRLSLPPIVVEQTLDHVKARVRVLTVNGTVNSHVWMDPSKIATANKKWLHEDTGDRMVWHRVTVTGESPTLQGWAVVAVLEPMKTDEGQVLNFVSVLPGETCPTEQRKKVNVCDHCRTNRRRTQTFILKHEDGTYRSVGRQCLKDFLGYHADPTALVAAAENLATLSGLLNTAEDFDDEGWNSGGYRPKTWDLTNFLTITACRVRLFGFLGASKAYEERRTEESTKAKVLLLLTPPSSRASKAAIKEWEDFASKHIAIPADTTTAENAIAWARDLPVDQLEASDYLANVNLVCRVGAVVQKTAGVAASVITAYQRAMERSKEQAVKVARPSSNHVGEIGKRLKKVVVTCERVILSEGQYGTTGIHKMHDSEGNDLVWFASKGKVLDEGATYTVAMTPTKHSEYQGRKQTTVNRLEVCP